MRTGTNVVGSAALLIGLSLATSASTSLAQQGGKSPLKVFVLAGQSNMEGQGVVDLDHPQYYNGGKGTLKQVMEDPAKSERFAHLKDAEGNWVARDDVWVRFKIAGGLKKGPLTIGFTGYPDRHHIGPELQFGHVVGDALDAQVLLIKTAWGGKSLFTDFRPPSSGGQTGPYYEKMLEEVREALENLADDFPSWDGRGYEIAGFVWFQGWNDMYDAEARAEYEQNLVNLIRDVRKVWGRPDLPVVIGELGNGGPEADSNMLAIRQAQAAAAARPEFEGTVTFVKTTAFARPREQSPNVGHGHHWFGNAESYFLIGDAMGQAMNKLLSAGRGQ
ncbi:MAG TPA: sialate O-acetylesterase [Thermoguttaceae bacterium]|nr:sialate O-acetylesterase [Thermoguttaceae bacterium]